ncbi:GNAT family N-acetyltransferase [Agreia pratensis]|uniref:Protein N-acetyltransferase, RimJ/RimL family n=1 Tax=Agreia pratensis TaxID=150121 RepID=A0A1X7K5R0_9MICO|nr:GNAT family N-acetyltransferase [Agreia pratensis]MBF4634349.1 GNAT family N-acetyltransferase [Agreia pratensis]SMG36192.1 Protein N-acetyltransferase, RimJ/RimL family [Agreia pratensis]
MTTPRVRLAFLGDEVYALLQHGDLAGASRRSRLDLPQAFVTSESWLWPVFRAKIAADPAAEAVVVRAIVDAETNVVVGHAGFHAPPDARGMLEVGYTVLEAHRRQGYATSTVSLLLQEAAEHAASVVRASVSPDNVASLAVVRKLGFVHVGEEIDDEDGLELVYERIPAAQNALPPSR